MITRKQLIAKLQQMQPGKVLFDGDQRSSLRRGGDPRHTAEVTFERLGMGVRSFSQTSYYTPRGSCHDTPKWFRQCFATLAYETTGDITASVILQALNA